MHICGTRGRWVNHFEWPCFTGSTSLTLCCVNSLSGSWSHIEGLVQECSISSALAMEILQSYVKPSIWCHRTWSALIHAWYTKPLPEPALIARFMGPTWGPSGSDRAQVGPMLAPWTLLSGGSDVSLTRSSGIHLRIVSLEILNITIM